MESDSLHTLHLLSAWEVFLGERVDGLVSASSCTAGPPPVKAIPPSRWAGQWRARTQRPRCAQSALPQEPPAGQRAVTAPALPCRRPTPAGASPAGLDRRRCQGGLRHRRRTVRVHRLPGLYVCGCCVAALLWTGLFVAGRVQAAPDGESSLLARAVCLGAVWRPSCGRVCSWPGGSKRRRTVRVNCLPGLYVCGCCVAALLWTGLFVAGRVQAAPDGRAATACPGCMPSGAVWRPSCGRVCSWPGGSKRRRTVRGHRLPGLYAFGCCVAALLWTGLFVAGRVQAAPER